MEIIKDKIKEIMIRVGYVYKENYSDKQINYSLNCWYLFDKKEKELQELMGITLECILYSKYYWCTQYKKRYEEIFEKDAGIDQQQYKIIEEITQRIKNVDWNIIQEIEEGKN